MARAVTRAGVTTIYGPGERIAGSLRAVVPIDDTPEGRADAACIDDEIREQWLRLLTRWEPEVTRVIEEGGDPAGLYVRIGVSAESLVILADLERLITAQAPGAAVQEILRLACGGRGERTLRRWRSGETLVGSDAHEYLSRVRDLVIIPAPEDAPYDETADRSARLRLELVLR